MLPYKVGDKIVCVDASFSMSARFKYHKYGIPLLVRNQIYIVTEIGIHPRRHILGVKVAGIILFWRPERFRPLVSPGVVSEIMRKALLPTEEYIPVVAET